MLQERVERMDKEKDFYYLLNFEKKKGEHMFYIMRKNKEKTARIKVDRNMECSCNCFDWKIRCKGMGIPCKHIYYLMHKMVNYELFEYFDNQVMKP